MNLVKIEVNQSKSKKVVRILASAIATVLGSDSPCDSENVFTNGTHKVSHWGQLFDHNGKVVDYLIANIVNDYSEKTQAAIIKELEKHHYYGTTKLFKFTYE